MIIKGLSDDQKRISINLKAKVVRAKDLSCEGCFFNGSGRCLISYCSPDNRNDKKNIIWVEDKK